MEKEINSERRNFVVKFQRVIKLDRNDLLSSTLSRIQLDSLHANLMW